MTTKLSRCTWDDVCADVTRVNPELARVINQFSPSSDYCFYKARYNYGDIILDQGRFALPTNDNKFIHFDSKGLPNSIRRDLDYNHTHPAGLLLNKKIEIFMTIADRAIPFVVLDPGEVFGLWQSLVPKLPHHQKHVWSICAGARSAFLLPQISDRLSHQRLQKSLSIKLPAPTNLYDHWALLAQIANAPEFPEPWHCDVLFFSAKWFEEIDDPYWIQFHRHLLLEGWLGTDYWRNKFVWDFTFSRAEANRNLRPNPYLADTVKHLFAIADGSCPGFCVQDNSDYLPLDGLSRIYQDVYQLKHYPPLIMALDYMQDKKPVYYSLQYPTAMELAPRSRLLSSRMEELREVAHVSRIVVDEILHGSLSVQGTPIEQMAKTVSFNYYHNERDKYKELFRSRDIVTSDPRMQQVMTSYPQHQFPSSSAYWRASVQIKPH